MMSVVKATIHKGSFKKLLTELKKQSNLYYKENDFIASENIHISLQNIDNLDELKPTIVEIFGHLEGDWIWSKNDQNVYDYQVANTGIQFKTYVGKKLFGDLSRIHLTGFQYGDKELFDDLTLIDRKHILFDMCRFYKLDNTRTVIVSDVSDTNSSIYMVMHGTLKLTGNDIVPNLFNSLADAYESDDLSELDD